MQKTIATAARARTVARRMWGYVQTQKKIADGVWFFETARHGGLVELIEASEPDEWRKPFVEMGWTSIADPSRGTIGLAYEEDCDWAVLCLKRADVAEGMRKAYWPHAFIGDFMDDVRHLVADYNPQLLEG